MNARLGVGLAAALLALPRAEGRASGAAAAARAAPGAPAAIPVPPPLRSAVEPAPPQLLLGLQTELSLAASLLPAPGIEAQPSPGPELPSAALRAFAGLETTREFDLFLLGLMPDAPKLRQRLAEARRDGDAAGVKSAVQGFESSYSAAVRGLAYAVAKSYLEGGLDDVQLGHARRALERYTEQGAIAHEAVEGVASLERAAREAQDAATLASARQQAQALLDSLPKDGLPVRPEPVVYPAQTSAFLELFDKEALVPGYSEASDRVLERLQPALESLRPAPGREILLVRFFANAYTTWHKGLLGDPERRGQLLDRLKGQLRDKAAQAGLRVLFRDETRDLKVGSDDEVILSLRHSETSHEMSLFGLRPTFPVYTLEVYLVGAKRPSPGKLVPLPQPGPARPWAQTLRAWGTRLFAAAAASGVVLGTLALLGPLPAWGQAAVVAAVLLGLAALWDAWAAHSGRPVATGRDWVWRVGVAVLAGIGTVAALKRAVNLAAASAVGAAALAWLSRRWKKA